MASSINITSAGVKEYINNTTLTSVTVSSGDIDEFAFYKCNNIASLTLNSGVTGILAYAFYGCKNLTSVTIPSSVTRIGDCAFSDCSGLTNVYIQGTPIISECAFLGSPNVIVTLANNTTVPGDSVGNGVVNSSGLFLSIDWMTQECNGYYNFNNPGASEPEPEILAIPNGIKKIMGSQIPDNSTILPFSGTGPANTPTGVFFPRTLEYIAQESFSLAVDLKIVKFSSITTSTTSTLRIDYNAFSNAQGLESIVIPSYARFLNDSIFGNGNTFSSCYSLKSVIFLGPVSDLTLSAGMFGSCSALTSVVLPEGLTSISIDAFSYCSALTTITIPSSVTHLGDYAFDQCSSLTTVSFVNSSNITSLGGSVFNATPYEASLYNNSNNVTSMIISNVSGKNVTLSWTASPKLSPILQYQILANDHVIGTVSGTTTSYVASITDYNYYVLKVATFVSGVYTGGGPTVPYSNIPTTILYDAANNITNLAVSGVSGDSVTLTWNASPLVSPSLEYQIFVNNQVVATVAGTITTSTVTLITIGAYSIKVGTYVNNSIAGSGPTISYTKYSVADLNDATNNITNLVVSNVVGSNVTITWTASPLVTAAVQYKIYVNNQLQTVVAGTTTTFTYTMTDYLLYSFKITILVEGTTTGLGIPQTVIYDNRGPGTLTATSVGTKAYVNNTTYRYAIISSGNIGEFAFYGAQSLIDVSVGSAVTGILAYAFYGCNALINITIPASVTQIGDCAFADCSALTTVTLQNASTTIAESAFMGSPNVVVVYPNGTTKSGESAGNGFVETPGNCFNINWTTKTIYGYEQSYNYNTGKRPADAYPMPRIIAIPYGITTLVRDSSILFEFQTTSPYGYFFPSTLTQIDDTRSFGEITLLKFSLLPSTTPLNIFASAFANAQIQELVIPPRIKFPLDYSGITNAAFNGCLRLSSVQFTGSLSDYNLIGKYVFGETPYLASLADAPNNITNLSVTPTGSGTTVTIAWYAPPKNSPIIQYELLINNQQEAILSESTVSYTKELASFTTYDIKVRMLVDGTTLNAGGALTTTFDTTSMAPPAWWSTYVANSSTIASTLASRYAPALLDLSYPIDYYLSNCNTYSGTLGNWATEWMADISANATNTKIINKAKVMLLYIYNSMMASSDSAVQLAGKAKLSAYVPTIIQITPTAPERMTCVGGRNRIYTAWTQPAYFWNSYKSYDLYVDGSLNIANIRGSTTYTLTNISEGTHTIEVAARNLLGIAGSKKSASVIISNSSPLWFSDISDSQFRALQTNTGERVGLNGLLEIDATQNFAVRPKILGDVGLSVQASARPTAPTNISAVLSGLRAVTVGWKPSLSDYPEPTTFHIQVTDTSTGTVQLINTSSVVTSFTILNLIDKHDYIFKVRAVNNIGEGVWSVSSDLVTILTVPMPPQNPILSSVDHGKLTLSWTPHLGGAVAAVPIFSYTIELVDISDSLNTITFTDIVFIPMNLKNKTSTYKFRVRANNQYGASGWSDYSNIICPLAIPGAPLDLSGNYTIPRGQDVLLTWSDVSYNIGPAVSSYVVSVNGVLTDTMSDAKKFLVTGLTYGTTNTITVYAKNINGVSLASNELTFLPLTVPGKPTISTVTLLDLSASILWAPPIFTCGLPIQTYTMYVNQWGIPTPIIRDISNGTLSYSLQVLEGGASFAVSATNSIGEGDRSDWYMVTAHKAVLPWRPSSISATPSQNSVTITWGKPVFTGYTPITGYEIKVYYDMSRNKTILVDGQTLSYVSTYISENSVYAVTVSAINRVGTGPFLIFDKAGVQHLTAVPSGDKSIRVMWDSPVKYGFPAYTSYQLFYSGRDGNGDVIAGTITTADTSYNFTNLYVRSNYLEDICNGASAYNISNNIARMGNDYYLNNMKHSFTISPTIMGHPPTLKDNVITCAPITGPGPVRNLCIGSPTATLNPYVVTINSQQTTLARMTYNDSGTVSWSKPEFPSPSGTLPLWWSPFDNTGGSPITSYVLDISSNSTRIQLTTSASSLTKVLTNISPGTYMINVAATNAYAIGEYTTYGPVTIIANPDPPTNVGSLIIDATNALISWTPPTNIGFFPLIYYELEYYYSSPMFFTYVKTVSGETTITLPFSQPTTYYYRIRTVTDVQSDWGSGVFGCSAWSPYYTYNRDSNFTGVISSVTAFQKDNNIQISWSPVVGSGPVMYALEGSIDNSLYSSIAIGTYDTQFTFPLSMLPLDNGRYTFRVKATSEYNALLEGHWVESNVLAYDDLPLNSPPNITALQRESSIDISWSRVPLTNFYLVEYSVNGVWHWGRSMTQKESITMTSYYDPLTGNREPITPGKIFQFKVVAIDVSGVGVSGEVTLNGAITRGGIEISRSAGVIDDVYTTSSGFFNGNPYSGYSTDNSAIANGWGYSTTVSVVDLGTGGAGGGAVCFLGNAAILTPSGYKCIDTLRKGDLVITADGRPVQIQRVLHQQIAASKSTNPYRIARGQFGATESLLISPNHRIMVRDRGMIEAYRLGLPQVERSGIIHYYNLELPDWEHDNLVVAGVEAESLAPVRRMTVSTETFVKLLEKRYGATITPAVIQKIKERCVFNKDGTVEVPLLREGQKKLYL